MSAEPVGFHLDPRCPWCWQTSKWVRTLARLNVIDVTWGVFCLEVQNFAKPVEEFDESRSVSAPSLRTLVAIRKAEGQAAAGRFYQAIGTRYFDGQEPLGDAATIEAALVDVGLDPTWCATALGDPTTWNVVMAEHQAIRTDTRSFGVPTLRLDGGEGPAIFGPVISNEPASDEEAVKLWEHVSWLVRYENFSELKRDRTVQPDLAYWRTAAAARKAAAAAAGDAGGAGAEKP